MRKLLVDVITPTDLFLLTIIGGYLAGLAKDLYRARAWRQGFEDGTRAAATRAELGEALEAEHAEHARAEA